MKFVLLLLYFFISANFSFSQLITSSPEFPTENDSIIIYLDTSQPSAEELLNYTGTLYVHTGINTSTGNWQNVIGDWGQTNQPALTKLGSNLYQLTIGYPKDFYNYTGSILQLALVFRSADGSRQTRPDIFYDLYSPGLSVVVNNPVVSIEFGDPLRSPVFAKENDTINIEISAVEIGTKISSLTLFINDSEVEQSDSNKLFYDFFAENFNDGINNIFAVGIDTAGNSDTTSFVLFINPPVENETLPSNIKTGINYIDNNTVTLALFAPYKEFVYLIGDFNDWNIDTDFYMKKYEINQDSVIWWLTINSLNAGEEYIFQYLVDGKIRIADPYTEKVSDPWNDQYITSATYPGLKQYPSGKSTEPASVIQTAQEEYQWEVENFERPDQTELIIYELLIRDFLAAHDYKTLIDTLNYLKNLGINAIELMPVNEFEGNESWGYNVSLHFAPDKYYGPKNELKRFIDECHKLGIAVIFDMVLNHTYGQSPLVRLYWNAASSRPEANNPWFNEVSPNQVFSFGYDFDHEAQVTKDYVDRVNRYWLEEFKFDGYRFDFTKGFTNTPGDGGSYDASRINNLKRMADKIWEFDSTAYVILEHFAPNNEEKILADYGMMLWGNLNYEYNEATMGYPSNLNWISYKARGWNDPHVVGYMESHDEERLMYKNLQFGNSSGSYNVKNLAVALNRIKLAAAFFFTIPGPKMIWQFGELGYDVSIDFNGRVGNKPIRWNYFDDLDRNKLYKTFAALINLRKYDAFKSSNFSLNVNQYGKRINITDSTMNVTIIGNFSVNSLSVNPNFQNTGIWYNYFNGDSLNVTDTQAQIELAPGEFHIYTTVKLPTPEQGILTDIKLSENENIVDRFYLEQNYPNPFNPTTIIKYSIPAGNANFASTTNVQLKVYDILGNEIITLVNEEKAAGNYEIQFNASNLSSGVYFYRIAIHSDKLKTEGFTSVKKMLFLK